MENRKKKSDFTAIGSLIQTVAGGLLDQPRSKGHKLRWQWNQAVGDQIAKHSEPIRLAKGVLTVRVDSPVWFSQLHHLQTELLATLQNHLPEKTVRKIKFRQGSLHTDPDWLKSKPASPPLPPPCQDDIVRAENLVSTVEDPEIREVLRRILLAHMTRTRTETIGT